MTDLPNGLREKMDAKCVEYAQEGPASHGRFNKTKWDAFPTGYQACWEDIQPLIEALEFYAQHETWDRNLMMVGAEPLRDDLEETSYSRFTPGKRARAALKNIRGDE